MKLQDTKLKPSFSATSDRSNSHSVQTKKGVEQQATVKKIVQPLYIQTVKAD